MEKDKVKALQTEEKEKEKFNRPKEFSFNFFPLFLFFIYFIYLCKQQKRGALIRRAEIIPYNLIRIMPAEVNRIHSYRFTLSFFFYKYNCGSMLKADVLINCQ